MPHRISIAVTLLVALLVGVPALGFLSAETCQAAPASPDAIRPHNYLPYLSANAAPTPRPWNWVDYLNGFRVRSGLAPVEEVVDWSHGAWLHARYIVKNDAVHHWEEPANRWYTPEGDAAARSSNLIGTSHLEETSDAWALGVWLSAPFHAVGMLDPELRKSGFATYREADGGLQMAAALDVLRGRGELPAGTRFPILWPAPGMVTPFCSHQRETPDPLTSCPGYTEPSGPPIILQVGAGDREWVLGAHFFMQDGAPLEHCVFDESSYYNPDASAQALGRALLASRDAVVLMPRLPLQRGATYAVSLTVNGQRHSWSFSVDRSAP